MATYLCRELGYEDCEFLFNPEENNPEKIVKHFTVAHGLVIKSGGEVITKDDGIKNREQKLFGAPFILKHGVSRNPFRTSFVIVATRHPVKNTVSWHFIFIGDTTHQKSSDFVLQLRVKSVSKEVNDLRWRIPSISAVEMVEAIKVGYFSIPLDILEEHYISSENSLQTSFIVQRVTSPEMKIGLEPTLWKIQIPWKNPWKYLSVDITEKKTDDSKIDTRIDEPTPEPVTCNKEYSSADATSEKKSDETKINDQPFCEPEFPPEPVKFNKTTCSSCGITPLQVKFYKCLQCSNITLCQNCHAKKIHSGHVFAIIQSLEQEEATRNKHILSKQLGNSEQQFNTIYYYYESSFFVLFIVLLFR